MSKIVPLFTSAVLPPLSECIIEGEDRLISRMIYGVVVAVGVAMYGRKAFSHSSMVHFSFIETWSIFQLYSTTLLLTVLVLACALNKKMYLSILG
jgi:hypothetical protein